MKFSIQDFFGKSDQIRSFLRIWSYLLKKSLMENFTFCAVWRFFFFKIAKINTRKKSNHSHCFLENLCWILS